MYCVKCRAHTPNGGAVHHQVTVTGRHQAVAHCGHCGTKKCQFIAGSSGGRARKPKATKRGGRAKRGRGMVGNILGSFAPALLGSLPF